ncbi:ribosomal-protein-alanine N-acetyltransferase [Pilibacter termitis]|uniref:Ribosomal-protein-alanine N-acetyltransferase n=1 Tax=Pilibacter termitis TaxID=263852 RepID=A0A1T4NW47_9ENTE|nr:GNAT family N-acetyltransferase [Pilibacter termitis]SJZ83590.1 ribosomal-protein-alanine N-acetyltransferase [Pilibacter termitis]
MKNIWRGLAENVVIETQRLYMRPKTMKDAEDIFEFESNPHVAKFVFPVETEIENTYQYIANSMREPLGKYALELKETGKVIGVMDFMNWDIHARVAEVGYTINEVYWRRGFATEALSKLLEIAFEELELVSVKAEFDIENTASGFVMEKSGMRRKSTYKKHDKLTKTIRKFTEYQLSRTEYFELKRQRKAQDIQLFDD